MESQWADADHRSLTGDYGVVNSRGRARNEGVPAITTSEKTKYTDVEIWLAPSDAFLLTEGIGALEELTSDAIERCEDSDEYKSDPSPNHGRKGIVHKMSLLPKDVEWFINRATEIVSDPDNCSTSHPIFR